MVIEVNTIQKNADELEDYKELLVKLNSKELLEQGIQLLLDNKKEAVNQYKDYNQKLKFFYTYQVTVLVYNHRNNEFRFINVEDYGKATTLVTSLGQLIVTYYNPKVNNGLLKSLNFPRNTLVAKVNDNTNTLRQLDENSDYAKTMIKNTIKRAKKALEEQFIKAPLGGGLEEAFIKEQTCWLGYNRAVLISLFPQFKSQSFKKLEKERLSAR